MVRAAGIPCSALHHHDGTVTIAAGWPDSHRTYPILCRLGSITTARPGDLAIHPGHALHDYTPQDILIVGCITNRDVADLILAYIVDLAARPPGTPWECLDHDRLEHLGFDGTARGFSRGRPDPSPAAASAARTARIRRWSLRRLFWPTGRLHR
ncbi:hypothetical protein JCM9534A_35090 [Catenuloplanes indicus JCM 9534]